MSDGEATAQARQLTDGRLQQSEQRFHDLVDAVTDYAIFMLDSSGHVATWNVGAAKTKGYSAEEIIGKHFSVFYTPEDRAADKPSRVLDTARREGRFEEEGWRVRKDGARFWANVVVTPLRSEDGEITGFAKVTRDLSAKRAAEERLHAAEERFHSLVDAVADYAIFMLDPTGRVETWNLGAKKIKGYDAKEIIGQHFSTFYTPEDRADGKPEKILEKVRVEGRFEDESWRVRKDGTRFWANVVITALRDRDGELAGFAKVTRDLTTRREAEENERGLIRETLAHVAADEQRRRLLTLLEHVPAVVNYVSGPKLVLELVHPNAHERLGRQPIVGKSLLEEAHDPTSELYCRSVRQAYDSGQPVSQTEVQASREVAGHRVDSYWNSVYLPVRDPAMGSVDGVMTFDLDVTENVRARKALEAISEENARAREELERLNRAKDEVLATMSHELRTPLHAIHGWASLLRKGSPDQNRLEHGLEVIERNAIAQTRLVSDLLDVSRIISGKLELNMAKTELSPVLHQAADVVRPAAESKGVRLVIDADPDIGAAIVDPHRIHQVLWNLLINAVRFTPRGGRITMSADRTNSRIVVSVRDTGAGIAAEHLPYIFERFRQIDSSTTRAHGGLGLGLAIVRHLVESHGGSVDAESDGLGFGTIFTVTLPIRAIETSDEQDYPGFQPSSRPPKESSATVMLRSVSVLVVDDDLDSLDLVREVLEQAGARVKTVQSAREALAALEHAEFDVIVSDIGMPEMDGYELVRNIRSREAGARTPAIALTAFARAEDDQRATTAGYQKYLSKPVEHWRLLEAVSTLCRSKTSDICVS